MGWKRVKGEAFPGVDMVDGPSVWKPIAMLSNLDDINTLSPRIEVSGDSEHHPCLCTE
jgi:hypothetical protein